MIFYFRLFITLHVLNIARILLLLLIIIIIIIITVIIHVSVAIIIIVGKGALFEP
jgi:hypothetical protein